MTDAWGTSWGDAWGSSWEHSDAPVQPAHRDQYSGIQLWKNIKEKRRRKKRVEDEVTPVSLIYIYEDDDIEVLMLAV